MPNHEQTIDFHGMTLLVSFDLYADDLSVDVQCLTVIVDGQEVDEITAYVNEDGIEEIGETLVRKYLNENGCLDYEIKTALLLRRINRGS